MKKSLNKLRDEAYQNALHKGFYDKESETASKLALIHSEVSEALEADRKGKYCLIADIDDVEKTLQKDYIVEDDLIFKMIYEDEIKGTFEEEMADIIIRVLDLCGNKKIDIEGHVFAKMKYNSMRPHMHGGKKY